MRRLIPGVLAALVFLALIVGFVALIGAYTFIPRALENSVARDIQDQLGLAEPPEVRLESDPQPAILTGTFSDGRVSFTDADFGGVRAESAVVDLEPFDVDMIRSIILGRTVGDEPISGSLRVVVTEGEVLRLAGENASVPISDIRLSRGKVVADSSVPVLGVEVPVSVEGRLDVRGGRLMYEPETLEAAGFPVPDEISDQLLSGAGFAYPLEELPEGVTLTGVEVEGGRMALTGEVEGLPLG